MRIHSLSKVIGAPLAILFLIALGASFNYDQRDMLLVALPLLIAVVGTYIFAPQIDFWWHERRPPTLDKPIVDWLNRFSTFYRKLSPEGKQRFETRLSLYMSGKDFKAMGSEENDMPEDIKAVIAHQAIILSFNHDDYLMTKYERFVVYSHPFPTPQKQFLHTLEVEHEDGMILLALDYAIPGITYPDQYYNVTMHAFIEAYLINNQGYDYPDIGESHIETLQKISGFTLEQVHGVVGHTQFELLTLAINYYFNFPVRFTALMPVETKVLNSIFGILDRSYSIDE